MHREVGLRKLQPPDACTSFLSVFAASTLNKDATHRFGGGSEEVAARIPALRLVTIHELQVGFVDERCGLQRLPRLFLSQLRCSESAELLINQRQELLGR